MRYEITGDNLEVLTLHLETGEVVHAEAGAMNHMSANMRMEAKMKGGLLGGLKRKFSGESLFLTEFTPAGESGYVAFAGNVPGRIRAIELHGNEFLAQKDAFLCAEDGVNLDITFSKKLGAGFFGGEGFILQKLSGDGTAFIHACGDFIEMDLASKDAVKVDTGSVVGFDATVGYDITRAGGIKTSLFGGEGLFLTTLTGPGHIILQSMTIANLAAAVRPFMPMGSPSGRTSGQSSSGVIGSLLGD